MKISDLKPQQPNVEVVGKIKSMGDEKSFDKGGRELRLVNATVEDDSGSIQLTLWNDDIDEVNEGDRIKLKDGYVKEYQGEKQLTTGRNGVIEILDSDGEGSDGEGEDNENGDDNSNGEGDDGDDGNEGEGKIEPDVEKI